MTDSVAVNDASSPAEEFQSSNQNELGDLGSTTAAKHPLGDSAEPSVHDLSIAPAEDQEAIQIEPPTNRPFEVTEAEGIASSDGSSTSQIGEPGALATHQTKLLLRQSVAAKKLPIFTAPSKVVGVGVVILVLAVAFLFYARRSQTDLNPALSRFEAIESVKAAESLPNLPEQKPSEENDHIAWEAKFRDVDRLRQRLMAKKEELLLLKQNYHYGVLELEEETARLIKTMLIDSLSQALKDRRLELALQSIQRRQAYRNSLDRPLRWIEAGSEEVLYLKRRAIFDLQLKEISEPIDMQSNIYEIDSALKKYEATAEALALENVSQLHTPLETIWKRVSEQAKTLSISAEDQRNEEIVAEVCSGNLVHLSELTNLTLKAARCLAESGAIDLFMSRLSRVSPAAVQKLAEWPGEWLCLNGLTRLSHEVARNLFNWSGQRLSLNGLSELPAEAAAYLAGWQGRQIELMGLRLAAGVEFLSRWEASGGRLYVPEEIRRQIEFDHSSNERSSLSHAHAPIHRKGIN